MSNYPTSIDDASTLLVPVDAFSTKLLQTTLAVLCLSTDTTLQLSASAASVGAPTANGVCSIEDEQIIYSGVSGNNLTGCTRGANGTTKIGHAAASIVRWRYVAAFDLALQAAVIALETAIGTTGAFNFASAGLVSDITLTSSSTALSSPSTPQAGQSLTYLVRQDGTGGRQITWSSDFQATTVDIDTTASTVSIFRFTGYAGKWVMDSYRTGVTL